MDTLAWLFFSDKQLNAAEDAAARVIASLPEQGEEFRLCEAHRLLGRIHHSKHVREKAIHHFQIALEIASASNLHHQLFWIHYELALLFRGQDEFDDAHDHIEQAKSHAVDDAYYLGCAMKMHAEIWYRQERLDDARSEVLHAIKTYEKLGLSEDIEDCRDLLGRIENLSTSRGSRSASELLK